MGPVAPDPEDELLGVRVGTLAPEEPSRIEFLFYQLGVFPRDSLSLDTYTYVLDNLASCAHWLRAGLDLEPPPSRQDSSEGEP